MLTLANITSTHGSTYYRSDNYYSPQRAEESSRWYGKGAQMLGLSGEVNQEEFKLLLYGLSPDGERLFKRSAGLEKRRAGLDFTVSAPKSVSLAALEDERIVEAHEMAVERTLELVERRYAQTRLMEQGKQSPVNTGNLVVAEFRHDTSREKDPQLHSHCVILNLTQPEGKQRWYALHNDLLYQHRALLGRVYCNELAYQVRQLGYEIEPTQTAFEIEGYSQEQLDHFSKRRQQILELVPAEATAVERQWANLKTRSPKGRGEDREDLRQMWQREASALGLVHPTPQHRRLPNPEIEAHKAVANAITNFQHECFDLEELEQYCLSQPGRFRFGDLEQEIEQRKRDGEFCNLGNQKLMWIDWQILQALREASERQEYFELYGDFNQGWRDWEAEAQELDVQQLLIAQQNWREQRVEKIASLIATSINQGISIASVQVEWEEESRCLSVRQSSTQKLMMQAKWDENERRWRDALSPTSGSDNLQNLERILRVAIEKKLAANRQQESEAIRRQRQKDSSPDLEL